MENGSSTNEDTIWPYFIIARGAKAGDILELDHPWGESNRCSVIIRNKYLYCWHPLFVAKIYTCIMCMTGFLLNMK